jgi:hypothetical protein
MSPCGGTSFCTLGVLGSRTPPLREMRSRTGPAVPDHVRPPGRQPLARQAVVAAAAGTAPGRRRPCLAAGQPPGRGVQVRPRQLLPALRRAGELRLRPHGQADPLRLPAAPAQQPRRASFWATSWPPRRSPTGRCCRSCRCRRAPSASATAATGTRRCASGWKRISSLPRREAGSRRRGIANPFLPRTQGALCGSRRRSSRPWRRTTLATAATRTPSLPPLRGGQYGRDRPRRLKTRKTPRTADQSSGTTTRENPAS